MLTDAHIKEALRYREQLTFNEKLDIARLFALLIFQLGSLGDLVSGIFLAKEFSREGIDIYAPVFAFKGMEEFVYDLVKVPADRVEMLNYDLAAAIERSGTMDAGLGSLQLFKLAGAGFKEMYPHVVPQIIGKLTRIKNDPQYRERIGFIGNDTSMLIVLAAVDKLIQFWHSIQPYIITQLGQKATLHSDFSPLPNQINLPFGLKIPMHPAIGQGMMTLILKNSFGPIGLKMRDKMLEDLSEERHQEDLRLRVQIADLIAQIGRSKKDIAKEIKELNEKKQKPEAEIELIMIELEAKKEEYLELEQLEADYQQELADAEEAIRLRLQMRNSLSGAYNGDGGSGNYSWDQARQVAEQAGSSFDGVGAYYDHYVSKLGGATILRGDLDGALDSGTEGDLDDATEQFLSEAEHHRVPVITVSMGSMKYKPVEFTKMLVDACRDLGYRILLTGGMGGVVDMSEEEHVHYVKMTDLKKVFARSDAIVHSLGKGTFNLAIGTPANDALAIKIIKDQHGAGDYLVDNQIIDTEGVVTPEQLFDVDHGINFVKRRLAKAVAKFRRTQEEIERGLQGYKLVSTDKLPGIVVPKLIDPMLDTLAAQYSLES